jgi:hypothetical protein
MLAAAGIIVIFAHLYWALDEDNKIDIAKIDQRNLLVGAMMFFVGILDRL